MTMRQSLKLKSLTVPFFYLAIALLITYPAVTQLSTHTIGAGYGDQAEYISSIWWARTALQTGQNPVFYARLGYPDGFSSAAHWSEPLTYWPAVPLAFIVGDVAAFNLLILITLTLNGSAAYALCWHLGGRRAGLPALLGGAVFMAFPTLQGHLSVGHSGVLALYAFPIFVLCLWRIVREGAGWRIALLGGLMFWLTAISNGVQVIFTLFPLSLFFLSYHGLFARTYLRRWPTIRALLILYGVGGLLCIPFFLPLLLELLQPHAVPAIQETGWVTFSTALLGFVSPSPFTPWGRLIGTDSARQILGTNSAEGSAYLGIVVVTLCIVAWLISKLARRLDSPSLLAERGSGGEVVYSHARVWLFIALGCMVFSLGPLLKWRDQPLLYQLGDAIKSNIVMPYALIQSLPFINQTRTPGRYNLVTGLAVAVLVSLAVAVILRRVRRRGLRVVIGAALLGAILVDYQLFVPTMTTPVDIPGYFAELRNDRAVRAVFDIPWDNNLVAKDAIWLQTVHQKPLIAGHVARRTPVDPTKLTILQAAVLNREGLDPEPLNALLRAAGVDVVIVHELLFGNGVAFEKRFGTFLHIDPKRYAYRVPLGTASPPTLYQTIDPKTGTLYVYVSADSLLNLTVRRPDQVVMINHLIVDGLPAAQLSINRLLVFLNAGYHSLSLENSRLSLTPSGVPIGEVRFGSAIRLMGSEISPALSGAHVMLSFRAEQDIKAAESGSLRVFVHALDTTGKLVAQFDAGRPVEFGDWLHGRTWSVAGEFTPPVSPLPPGTYDLYTGWYTLPDVTRFPVTGEGKGARDGLFYLGQISVKGANADGGNP